MNTTLSLNSMADKFRIAMFANLASLILGIGSLLSPSPHLTTKSLY